MMQSFFVWLTVAAALGAFLSTILHPGVPEIIIVLAVVNGLFYGIRSVMRKRRQHAAT
jgi:hypothetical protein